MFSDVRRKVSDTAGSHPSPFVATLLRSLCCVIEERPGIALTPGGREAGVLNGGVVVRTPGYLVYGLGCTLVECFRV